MDRTLLSLALIIGLSSAALAEPLANRLFGAKSNASAQRPAAIGTYAKGCGAGLAQLPESGPTWQAMRLSRNRNWGHPEMVDFLQDPRRSDTKWLQKVRPLWGHHYHFHVRLKCPKGSSNCQTQRPSVAELSKGGNGCDDTLRWWVTDALKPQPKPKNPPPRKRGARQYTMQDLPGQCARVLSSR